MSTSLDPAPAAFRRAHGRFVFTEPCIIQRDQRTFNALARNVSRGGICVQVQGLGSTALGVDVEIILRNFEPISATARWSHDRTFGFEFLTPIQDHPEMLGLIDELTEGILPMVRPRRDLK